MLIRILWQVLELEKQQQEKNDEEQQKLLSSLNESVKHVSPVNDKPPKRRSRSATRSDKSSSRKVNSSFLGFLVSDVIEQTFESIICNIDTAN